MTQASAGSRRVVAAPVPSRGEDMVKGHVFKPGTGLVKVLLLNGEVGDLHDAGEGD